LIFAAADKGGQSEMLSKIGFAIVIGSFISAIIEGLVLEKNANTFMILVATVTIMILAIVTVEVVRQGEKRFRF
jgi:hypothetical protein